MGDQAKVNINICINTAAGAHFSVKSRIIISCDKRNKIAIAGAISMAITQIVFK